MSHFLTFVTDGNGVIVDPQMADEITTLMNQPFAFPSVFLYSHGWWNDATAALNAYNDFSVGLVRTLRTAAAGLLPGLPAASLAVGIHWPSKASEDSGLSAGAIANLLQPLTFYSMEKRADDVGETGVYALLRSIVQLWPAGAPQLVVNLLGHSFGCKVVCSALAQLAKTCLPTLANVKFNVVLLQAAFENNDLLPNELYGSLALAPNLRLLITTSALDTALNTAFPAAHKLEFFSRARNAVAMGAVGPAAGTEANYGGSLTPVQIAPGTTLAGLPNLSGRFIRADLSPLHQARVTAGAYNGGLSGSHSDIYLPEIYALIGRFLYP